VLAPPPVRTGPAGGRARRPAGVPTPGRPGPGNGQGPGRLPRQLPDRGGGGRRRPPRRPGRGRPGPALAGLGPVPQGDPDRLAGHAWAKIEAAPGEQHPQGAMKRLLDRFGATRADVRPWWPEADSRGRWRRRLINEALRPAEATADWLAQIDRLRDESKDVDP